MLCFVSGDCQWSLESSLHQGHKLILVFEVLYCHTFVMFSVSVVLFILCHRVSYEHQLSLVAFFFVMFCVAYVPLLRVTIHPLCFMCWEVTDVSIHVTYRFKLDFELFKIDLFWNSSVYSSTVANRDTVGKMH